MFALADSWYEQADRGIENLPEGTKAPIRLARVSYHQLHDAIRGAGYQLEPRVKVPFRTKLGDAAAILPAAQLVRVLPAEALLSVCGLVADWGGVAAGLLATWIATQVRKAL